jgi:hypothetical protein
MLSQQRVRQKSTGREGVIVPDDLHICDTGEKLVRYDGETIFLSTRMSDLESVQDAKSRPCLNWNK